MKTTATKDLQELKTAIEDQGGTKVFYLTTGHTPKEVLARLKSAQIPSDDVTLHGIISEQRKLGKTLMILDKSGQFIRNV